MIDGLSKRITIRKGDTETFRFHAQSGGEAYALLLGEQYYFTVKKDTQFERPALIQKIVGRAGDTFVDIVITSDDTAAMAYGNYVWDLRRKRPDGEVSTPIYVKQFVVAEVVGHV